MKQEHVQEIVTALRSGQFSQGENALTKIRDGEQYHCCLGVMTILYAKDHPSMQVKLERSTPPGHDYITYDGDKYILPDVVQTYYGINSGCGTIRHSHMMTVHVITKSNEHHTLTELNDAGLTFNQIADVIEYFGEYI